LDSNATGPVRRTDEPRRAWGIRASHLIRSSSRVWSSHGGGPLLPRSAARILDYDPASLERRHTKGQTPPRTLSFERLDQFPGADPFFPLCLRRRVLVVALRLRHVGGGGLLRVVAQALLRAALDRGRVREKYREVGLGHGGRRAPILQPPLLQALLEAPGRRLPEPPGVDVGHGVARLLGALLLFLLSFRFGRGFLLGGVRRRGLLLVLHERLVALLALRFQLVAAPQDALLEVAAAVLARAGGVGHLCVVAAARRRLYAAAVERRVSLFVGVASPKSAASETGWCCWC
ncbi:unnamed protein product, partial [Pelagomonas calceolata]